MREMQHLARDLQDRGLSERPPVRQKELAGAAAGWADDRYAAFGMVEEGMDLVKAIEQVPVQPPKNAPKKEVKIVASGVI